MNDEHFKQLCDRVTSLETSANKKKSKVLAPLMPFTLYLRSDQEESVFMTPCDGHITKLVFNPLDLQKEQKLEVTFQIISGNEITSKIFKVSKCLTVVQSIKMKVGDVLAAKFSCPIEGMALTIAGLFTHNEFHVTKREE